MSLQFLRAYPVKQGSVHQRKLIWRKAKPQCSHSLGLFLKILKGQLISECLLSVLDFPKNQRKFWQISALESKKWSNQQSKFFVGFLENFKKSKRHSEINWPLVHEFLLNIKACIKAQNCICI